MDTPTPIRYGPHGTILLAGQPAGTVHQDHLGRWRARTNQHGLDSGLTFTTRLKAAQWIRRATS